MTNVTTKAKFDMTFFFTADGNCTTKADPEAVTLATEQFMADLQAYLYADGIYDLYYMRNSWGKAVVDKKLQEKGVESQDIILGVRPERTTVCFDKTEGAIESTILVNEMMGSELHLHVTTNGEDKIILRLPTIDLTDEQRASLTYGNKLYFTFASKVVHMFDPQTEESLLF
jgi:ABC-type sugar transport system ATPase subunit